MGNAMRARISLFLCGVYLLLSISGCSFSEQQEPIEARALLIAVDEVFDIPTQELFLNAHKEAEGIELPPDRPDLSEAVNYKSLDETVFTVEQDGKVTGVAVGTGKLQFECEGQLYQYSIEIYDSEKTEPYP